MQKNISHIATSLLPLSMLLTFIILSFSGCENKKSKSPIIPIEDTTEMFTSKDKQIHTEKNNTYIVKYKHQSHKITLNNNKIIFHDIQTPLVMLKIYKADCYLCKLQLEPLQNIQRQHPKKFSILTAIDTGQNKETTNLSKAIRKSIGIREHNSKPLIILYKKGRYYSHFLGSVPIEMISHDIQEAIKK